MKAYDIQYPQYGLGKHKGYPTGEHVSALFKYGPCAIHRLSYAPVRKCLLIKQPHVDVIVNKETSVEVSVVGKRRKSVVLVEKKEKETLVDKKRKRGK